MQCFRVPEQGFYFLIFLCSFRLFMKYSFLLLPVFFLLLGCAKTVEKAKENAVISAMTDGQWRMTRFDRAGHDLTTNFASYRFQFQKDNTVQAINNGITERTGSWSADPIAQTITSFFANSGEPVSLLNGTWKVTNNSWTFVEATQTVNGEALKLRIDK